jgi:hypothetical protein
MNSFNFCAKVLFLVIFISGCSQPISSNHEGDGYCVRARPMVSVARLRHNIFIYKSGNRRIAGHSDFNKFSFRLQELKLEDRFSINIFPIDKLEESRVKRAAKSLDVEKYFYVISGIEVSGNRFLLVEGFLNERYDAFPIPEVIPSYLRDITCDIMLLVPWGPH